MQTVKKPSNFGQKTEKRTENKTVVHTLQQSFQGGAAAEPPILFFVLYSLLFWNFCKSRHSLISAMS